MILLNSLICLLLVIIILHFFKFLKDRNSKREGFSEIKNNNGIENFPPEKQPNTDLHGEILKKMKDSSAAKNKNAIVNDTKTEEEKQIKQYNQGIAKEIQNDIKEIMSINEDVKKINESFKSRINK